MNILQPLICFIVKTLKKSIVSFWKMSSFLNNGPFFCKPWVPFIERRLVPSLVEIGTVILEKDI